jgi:ubiquinone/menaquinone biosynthesis C-methylase UbiE
MGPDYSLSSSKMAEFRYRFLSIKACNMCGSGNASHKILGKRLNGSQGRNPKKRIGITTTVCKCDTCGLIYSNPQPVPFDIQDHYGVPPENYWKKEYFTISPDYFKTEIDIFKTKFQFVPGMKALDIGAGLGKGMIALNAAGFDTYGFEPSRPFYERSLSQMGIRPDRLKFGMIEEMEYPENTFDFISFGAVLEHLYDPSDSIKKAMRWCKPNGVVHIEVPSSDWLINKIINFYYRLTGTDYVGNISPMHEPFHLYEFGLSSFEKHALLHNYKVAHHQYFVSDTYMPSFVDFFIRPYMRWTNKGMQLSIWLQKK